MQVLYISGFCQVIKHTVCDVVSKSTGQQSSKSEIQASQQFSKLNWWLITTIEKTGGQQKESAQVSNAPVVSVGRLTVWQWGGYMQFSVVHVIKRPGRASRPWWNHATYTLIYHTLKLTNLTTIAYRSCHSSHSQSGVICFPYANNFTASPEFIHRWGILEFCKTGSAGSNPWHF